MLFIQFSIKDQNVEGNFAFLCILVAKLLKAHICDQNLREKSQKTSQILLAPRLSSTLLPDREE